MHLVGFTLEMYSVLFEIFFKENNTCFHLTTIFILKGRGSNKRRLLYKDNGLINQCHLARVCLVTRMACWVGTES